jgi:HlyD family secretion protein
MRRWLIRLLIAGGVLGVLAAAIAPAMMYWAQKFAPKYLTAQVSHGRVETVVNSTGTIKPVRTVSVGAFTSGPVAKVNVDYNSVVRKGAELAIIDDKLQSAAVKAGEAVVKSQEAAIASQQADLKRIHALLEQARNNEKRAMDLRKIKEDYLSDTEKDQFHFTTESYKAQAELTLAAIKQAEANRDQAQANLKNSLDQLGYTKIICPENGVVIERKVDEGQTVAASFQTPELFTIGVEMDKHMHVYASVDEADMGMIHKAKEQKRPVKFTLDAYPGELFEGHIYQIRLNATTTQNVVTYPVIIETEKPDPRLMPNMTTNISFEIDAKENVLRLPVVALRYSPLPYQVREEDRHYVEAQPPATGEAAPKRTADEKAEQARKRQHRHVWVQEGQLLRAVPVTLGLIDNQFAEVVEGDLHDGQAVVTGTENLFVPR